MTVAALAIMIIGLGAAALALVLCAAAARADRVLLAAMTKLQSRDWQVLESGQAPLTYKESTLN
jgi:hypothetical protein